MKSLKILGIFTILCLSLNLQAEAGFFSKVGNWFNTGWNDYGYPSHNSYYNSPHRNNFYNNGSFTGITPPVSPNVYPGYYPPANNYYCPNNVNRFNHLPNNQIPDLNVPTQVITNFKSDVSTGAGVHILD